MERIIEMFKATQILIKTLFSGRESIHLVLERFLAWKALVIMESFLWKREREVIKLHASVRKAQNKVLQSATK